MQLRHEKKMYPPRVKMMVDMKSPDDHDVYKLSVKIEGCSEEDQLDIQLCFPPSMHRLSFLNKLHTCLFNDGP